MLKRILAALGAVVMSSTIALAVITGTWSEKQDEQVSFGQLQLGSGQQVGSNTPSFNAGAGSITTAALSTGAQTSTAITLTNNRIAVGDTVLCTLEKLTTAGLPFCASADVTAGQVVFQVGNASASALTAAVRINFVVIKGGNPN